MFSEPSQDAPERLDHVEHEPQSGELDAGVALLSAPGDIDGLQLRSVLKQRVPLAPEVAVDYALQVCAALASTHAPASEHGELRAVLGLPRYLAPEQVRTGSQPAAASDVWSTGCVLYELLTGQSPFDRNSLMQICAAVLEQDPAPLAQLREGLPEGLSTVVSRCLQKPREARFADVAELGVALQSFGSGRYDSYPERCRARLDEQAANAASAVTRCRDISVASEALTATVASRPKPASRMATLAFDLTALSMSELDKGNLTVRSAVDETPPFAEPVPATQLVAPAHVPAPAAPAPPRATARVAPLALPVALTAALLCTLWGGVMLLVSVKHERPEQPRLLHLVTPRQELSPPADVTPLSTSTMQASPQQPPQHEHRGSE